jgi:hypothetical protein
MRGDILFRLRQIAGGVAPRALGFVEGPVGAPADRKEARPPPEPRVPPEVVAAAAAIADPELRERFLAAAGRYLGRFSPVPPRTRAAGSEERGSD